MAAIYHRAIDEPPEIVAHEGQHYKVEVQMMLAVISWPMKAQSELSVLVFVWVLLCQELRADSLHMSQKLEVVGFLADTSLAVQRLAQPEMRVVFDVSLGDALVVPGALLFDVSEYDAKIVFIKQAVFLFTLANPLAPRFGPIWAQLELQDPAKGAYLRLRGKLSHLVVIVEHPGSAFCVAHLF